MSKAIEELTREIILFPSRSGPRDSSIEWSAECLTKDYRHFVLRGESPQKALEYLIEALTEGVSV
jgi:hypothetical protein